MISILHRSGYDARNLQNDVNRVLVSAMTVESLLTQTTQLVGAALEASYCFVIVTGSMWSKPRIVGAPGTLAAADIATILAHKQLHVKTCPKVLTLADIKDKTLLRGLHQAKMAIVASLDNGDKDIRGFLVLGVRSSGHPYNSHDMRTIGTIATELAFAVQKTVRYEQAEKFNAALQQKVEDATNRLRQTNAKLKALDQTKDDFISMASHQLRTPLTSVKGYMSMVLDGDAGELNETQQKLLNQAFISSQRMVYLISDLLNVSRMRTGKFLLEEIPCNLAEVIGGEVSQLVETAKSRNLELSYEKPDSFPTYLLDETKLRQVIMNFIDNAIYYTPDEGHIVVKLVERPTTIEFTVVDDGMGVPKHDQHRLFSKFFRAHNAKRARPDGTGLGLFMAKKVVIAQGGAIVFRSTEGKGSTFGFSFAKSKLKSTKQL